MKNLSLKVVVVGAVLIGVIVGVSVGFAENATGGKNNKTTANATSEAETKAKELPLEVLKALPPEELAEMYPEKAEAILNPESASQIKSAGSDSNDPEYLRAVIQKLGGEAPETATTKELQDILANLSGKGETPTK